MIRAKELVGKTIQSLETIHAEGGRTYEKYLFIVCTDGSKIMLAGNDQPYRPRLNSKMMRKAALYFTEELIKKQEEKEEKERINLKEEQRRNKKCQLRKLQQELEEMEK